MPFFEMESITNHGNGILKRRCRFTLQDRVKNEEIRERINICTSIKGHN